MRIALSPAWMLAVLLSLLPGIAPPQWCAMPPPLAFPRGRRRRFNHLVAELRCVMCQNQSLADSNALIALTAPRGTGLMRGTQRCEIGFLVARYGEFVLYKPRMEPATWLLWLGPGLLLLGGALVIVRILRTRSRQPMTPDDAQEW